MDRILLAFVVVVGVPAATVLYVALVEWVLERLPDRIRSSLRPWLWVGPAFLLLIIYLIYPTLNTIYLSFLDARSAGFVGLDNYIFAFTNNQMLIAFRNNFLWVVLVPFGVILFGLIIALLSDRVSYEALVKGLIFLPMVISFVAAGVIWRLMYDYAPPGRPQTGFVNAVLNAVIPGFEPQVWTINQPINNFALMAVGIWMWTGFATVILSAGLKSIPEEILEAARVDGANEWRILWSITLPMISSTIAVVATTMVINVLKVFDIVYVMTNGNFNTEVIANRMYKEMFIFNHIGRASAIAVILMLAIVPIMLVNIRRFQEQESVR